MTRLLITFIFLNLLTSCRQDKSTNTDFDKYIDQEIADRISKIEGSIESNISRSSKEYVEATKIHRQINDLLNQIAISKDKDSITACLNDYFITVLYYLSVERDNFIKINSSAGEQEIISSVKLNELTLLDRILLSRENKIGAPSYKAQFVPIQQTDTTYTGDVILLKTDTLYCQKVLVNFSETFKDTVYLAIALGKGKFIAPKKALPHDFNICGYVKAAGQFIPYKYSDKIK